MKRLLCLGFRRGETEGMRAWPVTQFLKQNAITVPRPVEGRLSQLDAQFG